MSYTTFTVRTLHRLARTALVLAAAAAAFAAVSSPAFAQEGIVWSGDFETGDFSQWAPPGSGNVHALPGRATVVPDPVTQGNYAARFEVRPGDKPNPNWSGELAQVLTSTKEGAGQEWYWAWSTMFPADFPTTYGWCVFMEWHQTGLPGVPQGPAPINFDCKEDRFRLIVRGGDEPNWTQQTFYFPGFERGIWHDFVFHVRWSPDADGFIELWHNGKLIIPKTHLPTMYRNQGLYPKIGYYRKDVVNTQTGVIYHDAVRRSTTLAGLADTLPPAPVARTPLVAFRSRPHVLDGRRVAVAARAVPWSKVGIVVRGPRGRVLGIAWTQAGLRGLVFKRVRLYRYNGQRRLRVSVGARWDANMRRIKTTVALSQREVRTLR